MVSLEEKMKYRQRIIENPKLSALNSLLQDRPWELKMDDLHETDEIYFNVIRSIQTNDKNLFELNYHKKNKSNPSKESPTPFVNDDFLIFTLIAGIVKFNFEKDWIKKIVGIRTRNKITITFENIINEDFNSNSNLPEVMLMFHHLTDKGQINNQLLTKAFKSVSESTDLFDNRNDFHTICAICAYDLCIMLKVAPDGSEIKLLYDFNAKFLRRVKFLTWIIQTATFVSLIYFFLKLLTVIPSIKDFFEKNNPMFTLMGVLGISVLGNFIPIIKKYFHESILRLLGYSKGLIMLNKSRNDNTL